MAIKRDANGKAIPKPKPMRRTRKPLHSAAPNTVSGGPTISGETLAQRHDAAAVVATATLEPSREPARADPEVSREPTGDRRGARTGNAPAVPEDRIDERGPLPEWACGKKLRGERAGLLCRNPRIRGAKTCRMHGSATLRSREKAEDLIIASTYPAVRRLRQILNDPAAPYTAVISAAKDLLDRADLAGKTKVEVDVKPFEQQAVKHVRISRSRPGKPATDAEPEVIDAEVIEDEPEWRTKLAGKVDAERPSSPADTRPAERWENSDDTPPPWAAGRVPGYDPNGGNRIRLSASRR